jgi:hypothetical protein
MGRPCSDTGRCARKREAVGEQMRASPRRCEPRSASIRDRNSVPRGRQRCAALDSRRADLLVRRCEVPALWCPRTVAGRCAREREAVGEQMRTTPRRRQPHPYRQRNEHLILRGLQWGAALDPQHLHPQLPGCQGDSCLPRYCSVAGRCAREREAVGDVQHKREHVQSEVAKAVGYSATTRPKSR